MSMNYYYFLWDTPGNIVNSLLTVIVGTLVLAYPIFVPCFYWLRRSEILDKDKNFFARFGSAIEGLNFSK